MNYVCGRISFITSSKSIIELDCSTIEKGIIYTFKVVNEDYRKRIELNNDINLGLYCSIVYNENYEIVKISYLKGGV